VIKQWLLTDLLLKIYFSKMYDLIGGLFCIHYMYITKLSGRHLLYYFLWSSAAEGPYLTIFSALQRRKVFTVLFSLFFSGGKLLLHTFFPLFSGGLTLLYYFFPALQRRKVHTLCFSVAEKSSFINLWSWHKNDFGRYFILLFN
jgi:hypothetical protein